MLQPVGRSPFSKLVLAFSLLLPLIGVARAQTIYTNSSTSGSVSWLTGPNWSETPVSSSNTAIRFQGTLGGNLTITQDTGANFVLNALTIVNSGAFAMNFTGGVFEFSKSGANNPLLTFATATTTIQTFSNNFVLNDTLALNQASATVSNSTVAGVISGAGGLRKSGTGNVYITGTNNSFGGGFTNSAGTLFVA
jgi:autotransporter-associated beta strand protein